MHCFRMRSLVVVGIALAVGAFAAKAEVVYDNTTTGIPVSHNLGTEEGGDQVVLAGTERFVTELEIAFESSYPGTASLRVRMYMNDDNDDPMNDGPDGKPGTVLYDSLVMVDVQVAGFNTLIVNPDVTVPDTFTWTLQRVDGANLQMPRYGPPTIGSSGDFFWVNSQGTFWHAYTTSYEDSFYARVVVESSDPVELLSGLVQIVVDLNLHHGIENSLDAKLDSALNALDDVNENNDVAAVNTLQAFINAVEAQRDNKIPGADADLLIAGAQAIIDLLNEG